MAAHQDRTITVELSDSGSPDDELRLDDFLEQMRTLKAALRETERLSGTTDPSLYFRIKRIQKNSPPKVTLEAVSDSLDERSEARYANYVVRRLTTNLRVISNKQRLPERMDFHALESYRELAVPAEKHHLKVRIQAGRNSVLIDSKFRETIDKIAGDDEHSIGSVSGKIEAINLHDRNRKFQIFPTIGPSRVWGTFKTRDRALFANAVDKYVTVYGRLHYKKWDRFPYAINAESIDVHDIESLPTLADLGGMAPDATGLLNSQEFIDRLRDGW
jgi:hypothetical protein